MANAKILADRISITSEVLTDENIEKVGILAPSTLILTDERDESKVLYQVCGDIYNNFNTNGAAFKEGKTLGTISEEIMGLEKEAKEAKITTLLTAVVTRINAIEDQVSEYLENAEDLSDSIEFLD